MIFYLLAAMGGAMIGFLLFCIFAVATWSDDEGGGRR